MKKLLFAACILAGLSCQAQSTKSEEKSEPVSTVDKGKVYGQAFSEKNVMTVGEVVSKAKDKDLNDITVTATIEEVCQAEGCWMRVAKEDGSTMLVKFKNHNFTIPKDLAGSEAVFHGRAYQTTVSVEMQRHYAEDAGKSKEEIASITKPSTEIAFEATGLIIK